LAGAVSFSTGFGWGFGDWAAGFFAAVEGAGLLAAFESALAGFSTASAACPGALAFESAFFGALAAGLDPAFAEVALEGEALADFFAGFFFELLLAIFIQASPQG
jgi:hypothetical protein